MIAQIETPLESDEIADGDEYSTLGRKIRKFFPRELFYSLPRVIQSFLLDSQDNELSDTQLMYLSRIPWNEDSYTDIQIADAKNILTQFNDYRRQYPKHLLKGRVVLPPSFPSSTLKMQVMWYTCVQS